MTVHFHPKRWYIGGYNSVRGFGFTVRSVNFLCFSLTWGLP